MKGLSRPPAITLGILLLISAPGNWAQRLPGETGGTETKRAVTDFPVHGRLTDADVGAEFMVRLISYGRESFVTDNFLVVEVAIYPHHGKVHAVKTNEFSLRVNNKKEPLLAQAPGSVIASIRYPDWEYQQGPSGGLGFPGSTGGINQPAPVERFPGDPRAQPRGPRPIGNPDAANKPPHEERMPASEVITRSALPEGTRKSPVSGYAFFPWRGNPAKLKSVELVIMDEHAGPVTLRLR